MASVYNLTDEFIGQLAKLVQLSMLTGTNVVDHLRLVRVNGTEEGIVLTPEYKEYFDSSIQKMLSEVEAVQETMRTTEAQA